MKARNLIISSALSCLMVGAAHANWEYSGVYTGDGWYMDDGARFIVSVRGGASMGFGGIKNKMGALTGEYYYSPDNGAIVSAAYYKSCIDAGGCEGFEYAGMANLSELGATEDYSSFSFAAGASMGWTIPNTPQWRVELGWDHIAESDYNASPLFAGDLALDGGNVQGLTARIESGGAHSKLTADIFSVMAFYDFFDGLVKPTRQMIPYVGFGMGYADVKTVLNLTDLYGDLSLSAELQNYGELDQYGILQFYQSEKNTGTVAGLLAAGFSYGITESMFLDLGARLTYVPTVKWALTTKDGDRDRDWFNGDNMFWVNIMLGMRFEF